jgi:hypothetical protein
MKITINAPQNAGLREECYKYENHHIVRRQNGRTATSILSQAYGLLFQQVKGV